MKKKSLKFSPFGKNKIHLLIEFLLSFYRKTELNVVVKMMKPPSQLRTNLNMEKQFVNEVFIYKNVIPTILAKFQTKFRTIEQNLWCPQVYMTEIGLFPALSDETETILAMENLAEKGFRLGPRINLTVEELTLMTRAIAQYHASNYALRINKDPDLEMLINGIAPFNGFQNHLYQTALERVFTYLDNNPNEIDGEMFGRNVNYLKTNYGTTPVTLMKRFLRSDNVFSVILHGDYNRNNVLFKYEQDTAVDLRFIDFQEVKYGSPAIDLSFFMYMNMQPSLFENGLNEKLLRLYHEHLIESLCELLECKQHDVRLSAYGWDTFYEHYKQFALYGALVSVMFSK